MAMNYKPSMTKAELLEIAAANGVQADDGMTKRQFLPRWTAQTAARPTGRN